MSNVTRYFLDEVADHAMTVEAMTLDRRFQVDFIQLVYLCVTSIAGGGKILLFGNGGSAADAQHIATEFTVRYQKDRVPIPALALTTDTSALTAIGNDLAFSDIFARQIDALGRRDDVAIGLTTSGQSSNVLSGLDMAIEKGMFACAFTGHDGGDLESHADPLLRVPSNRTNRIQEMHILLGHMLCGALERELGLVPLS